jgi:hypothetical protein
MAVEREEYVSDLIVIFCSIVSYKVFSLENTCDHIFLSRRILVFQANLAGYYWNKLKFQ